MEFAGVHHDYCLKWNAHQPNLIRALREIKETRTFANCTLVVDGGVEFKVHQAVLATSSEYLKQLLHVANDEACVVLLPGVQEAEMRVLVDFMYTGEASAADGGVAELCLQLAEHLGVKGVAEKKEEDFATIDWLMEDFEAPLCRYESAFQGVAAGFDSVDMSNPSQAEASQKIEWKRYKQYSKDDVLCAIECVRSGMSALQASRKFGVPSRTLYDKVKKMGITNGRKTVFHKKNDMDTDAREV